MKQCISVMLWALSGILGAAAWQGALAQSFPNRPIRVIVPYPPGSPTDILMRAVSLETQKGLGQPLIVENRPGGSGIIGAEACKLAQPDGYTYCLLDRNLPTLPFLFKKLPFDALKDFEPVTQLNWATLALVVPPSVGANNMAELAAVAKAKPGALNYGSLGTGGLSHIVVELLKKQYAMDLTHVPYKSPPELVQALFAGDTQVAYMFAANFLGPIRGGKLRALGVSGDARSPLLPDVPTLREQGLTSYDVGVWNGLFAPVGTPRDAILRVQREMARIIAIPEFREKSLTSQGLTGVAGTPEEFARLLRADFAAVAELAKASGAKAE